jgi:nucleotide-binding universal stress UspA family protein
MYQKIMVPLDGSEMAECVLPHVEALVGGGGVKEVILVRAVAPFHLQVGETHLGEDLRKEIDDKALSDAMAYLERVAGRIKRGDVRVRTEVLYGKITDSLVDFAASNDIALVIIATHGRSGVSRWVWGSVADRILHSACIPVLMVRAPGCVPGV